MIWYGVEAAVESHPEQSADLIAHSKLPKFTRFIARRLTGMIESQPTGIAALVSLLADEKHASRRADVLQGMADALRGWRKAAAPSGWRDLSAKLANDPSEKIKALTRELSVVFGDGRAIDDVKRIVTDSGQSLDDRRQAIRSLAAARVDGLAALLKPLLADKNLADEAVRAVARLDLEKHAPQLLAAYKQMPPPGKEAALAALATRPDTALLLVESVREGRISRDDVSPVALRQMQLLGDAGLNDRIASHWPQARLIAGDKLKLIASYRSQLDEKRLTSADAMQGRGIFTQACAKCHKLFGEGGAIGPDLTGAQRTNLNYWLENIVDPSATLADSFKMSIIRLDDGRTITGVVTEQTERTLTVQTPTEKQVIERQSIDQIKPSDLSLMPDGLLAPLSPDQVRDLVGYLMSPNQVELPAGK
jgi:putative heme-binding domain-containing protein